MGTKQTGMSKKEVIQYLSQKARYIKGVSRNGVFEPVAMLSKVDDSKKRTALTQAMARMHDIVEAMAARVKDQES